MTSFSNPGDRVALLPWPTTEPHTTGPHATGPAAADPGEYGHRWDPEPPREAAAALAVIDDLDRTAHVLPVGDIPLSAPASAPASDAAVPHVAPESGADRSESESESLVILAAPPDHITTNQVDHADPAVRRVAGRMIDELALIAARSLRLGGIFIVLTHCDWTREELLDPGGLVVDAGQRADLLYLQHIVALHRPVRDGRFTLGNGQTHTDGRTPVPAPAGDAGLADDAHESTPGRDMPAAHRRIHSDIYVFAEHTPTPTPQETPLNRPQPLGGTAQNLESSDA